MSQNGFKRKLAAILSADVEGYSRLMGEDEEATVRTLTTYREVLSVLIKQHNGKVIDSPGDNLLAEFASVVDAVQGAVAIQKEIKARNQELPENRKMRFRIGINIGDVIQEEERIYGDGVNIAARLEGLAIPGGICISKTAFDHIESKLPYGYEFLGDQTVKNIAKPVGAYRVLMEPRVTVAGNSEEKKTASVRRIPVLAGTIALIVLAVAGGLWHFYLRRLSVETTSEKKMSVPLPERPTIAVLPFKNLSGNAEQEYFSDGITNDIITDLSKFSQLFVIASNTVFAYKNKPVGIGDISTKLGVRYVVEGTVQKAGDKVRINTQLIDTATDHHLWAERYERSLNDIFALQDEIVQTIVAALAIKVSEAELARAKRKDTSSLEAYDYVMRGWEYFFRYNTRSANIKAKEMFRKSIELDSDYNDAYTALGWANLAQATNGWTEFADQALQRAYDLAKKGLIIEESDASAHALLGTCYLYRSEYDLAISELKRAIALNPNSSHGYYTLGWGLLYSGPTEEAIKAFETARRLDPDRKNNFLLGLGYYLRRRYDDAVRVLKQGLSHEPNSATLHTALAATYAQAGRMEDAAREAKMVLEFNPFFEVDAFGTAFRNPEDREQLRLGLRKAGLK